MATQVPVYDSDDDIPEVDFEFSVRIQPYMYEPVRIQGHDSGDTSDDDSDSSDSDGEAFVLENSDRLTPRARPTDEPTTDNCMCGNCATMPTEIENKCCVNANLVHDKATEAGLACITDHEGFKGNCLNRHVIEMCHYRYNEQRKDLTKCGDIHEVYRYIAYRNFVQWIYQRLGKGNRKVLPSCVVSAIRKSFPSEQYCGFKYPTLQ